MFSYIFYSYGTIFLFSNRILTWKNYKNVNLTLLFKFPNLSKPKFPIPQLTHFAIVKINDFESK